MKIGFFFFNCSIVDLQCCVRKQFLITESPFKNCCLLIPETKFKTIGCWGNLYYLAGLYGFYGFGTHTSCEEHSWDSALLKDSSFFLCCPRLVNRDTLGLFSSSRTSGSLVSCREGFQSFLVKGLWPWWLFPHIPPTVYIAITSVHWVVRWNHWNSM